MSRHGDDDEKHSEIIVVHRHGDHEEGHHGGAWKIAFADFMTAMMTFFLVMWLINSTDDQTLAQVATYFNPIKLTDREKADRGIHDADFGGPGKETVEQEKQNKREGKSFSEPKNAPGERRFAEEELFADPYSTLSKLAAAATSKPSASPSGELRGDRPGGVQNSGRPGGVREEGVSGGMAFRDPFDPDFRRGAYEGPVDGGDAILKQDASAQFPRPHEYRELEKHSEAASPSEQREKEKENKEVEAGENSEDKEKATDKPTDEAIDAPADEAKGKPTDQATDTATEKTAAEAVEKAQSQGKKGSVKKKALANLKVKNGHGPKDKGQNAAEKSPLKLNGSHNAKAKEKGEDKPKATAKHNAKKKGGEQDKAALAPDAPSKSEVKKEEKSAKEIRQEKRMQAIKEEARVIKKEFMEALKKSGLLSIPYISLEATEDGVLISMTDKMNFEMFAIASAEPRPEVVVVMEKLAHILAKQKGSIIIRGHTDSRPFRSKTYDNWRLSSARAHMTYYMLVRGGVLKSRVERIEGYADRDPKIPQNTRAAANRRIEILLRPPKA